MARIFVSHASKNNSQAIALAKWLFAKGWNDVFLDLDPKEGLIVGERWQVALRQATERCEVFLFLLSPEWIASDWCKFEYVLAKQLNKQIVCVVVSRDSLEMLPTEITAEWHVIQLASGAQNYSIPIRLPNSEETIDVLFDGEGLSRLEISLQRAGLTPTFFEWPPANDPNRPPFPGLRPLLSEDAGIFFGRDSSIIAGLDIIRGLRAVGGVRILVILGASGSGKSSFLRAGLIPRLARNESEYIVLPVVRPARNVLYGETGLASAFATAMGKAGLAISRIEARAALKGGAEGTLPLISTLTERHRFRLGDTAPNAPSLTIIVDQGEELFTAEAASEASEFLHLLDALNGLKSESIVVIIAMRSDSYDQFQSCREIEAVPQSMLNLPPMPGGAYVEIIRRPIERAAAAGRKIGIENSLVEALLVDVEKGGSKDSLPLLAFTLERLYREGGGDGDLTLDDYRALGGIKGSIEAAVDAALQRLLERGAVPQDRTAQLALLKRALIPWLAGIDPETGSPRRRIARMTEIPSEAQSIVTQLIEDRLLSKDVDLRTHEVTVEPTHEALLRQWGTLGEWLKQDLPALTAIEGIQRAARDWLANARDSEWLTHRGARLAFAQMIIQRDDLRGLLTPGDQEYLAHAQAKEDEAQNQKVRTLRRQRTIYATTAAALSMLCFGLWYLWNEAQNRSRDLAASLSVTYAQQAFAVGDMQKASIHAVQAVEFKSTEQTRSSLFTAASALSPYLASVHKIPDARPDRLIWQDTQSLLVLTIDGLVRRLKFPSSSEAHTKDEQIAFSIADKANEGRLVPRGFAALNDGRILMVLSNGTLFSTIHGRPFALARRPDAAITVGAGMHTISASANGARLALVTDDGVLLLRCEPENLNFSCSEEVLMLPGASATSLSSNGDRLVVGFQDGSIKLFEIGTSTRQSEETKVGGKIISLDWSIQQDCIAAGTSSGEVLVLKLNEDLSIRSRASRTVADPIADLQWAPDGQEFAFSCGNALCISRVVSDQNESYRLSRAQVLTGHMNEIISVSWSNNGESLATGSLDGTVRIWSRSADTVVRHTLWTETETPLIAAAFDIKSGALAAGGADGYLYVWNSLGQLMTRNKIALSIAALAWSSDGRLAVANGDSGYSVFITNMLQAKAGALSNLSYSKVIWIDEARLAAISKNPAAAFIIESSGGQSTPLEVRRPNRTPWGITLHPSLPKLFVSFSDGAILSWNSKTVAYETEVVPEQVSDGSLQGRFRGARSVEVSPDGAYLAATRYDGKIILHSIVPGRHDIYLQVGRSHTNVVAFSPNGQWLAALDEAGTIYVWKLTLDGASLHFSGPGVPQHFSRSSQRKPTALIWISNTRLALPTSDGTVEIQSIENELWLDRVRHLFAFPQ
ncbi:TIR domain-containing protein [Dankookia rubra]|uniref:TIR domain-containing protein n=1 Tax=Dankookia rubra TaxID=1442381 RepID=A0A4R5QB46_9PROT|nr:TIR domain-containing protein [Dankookia rubra]TDH59789.1 TIR domain-containing protein [Dankookia rubra]